MDMWSKGLSSPIRLPSGPSNSMTMDNVSKNRSEVWVQSLRWLLKPETAKKTVQRTKSMMK